MKLIGLMLARSEDWVLGCSLRAACQWCDEVIFYAHNTIDTSFDLSQLVSREFPGKIFGRVVETSEGLWDEMDMRQHMLEDAREHGADCIAIIDGDEVLTHNVLELAHDWFYRLDPGELLEVPMIPVSGDLDHQRTDPPWVRRWLTVGFRDKPDLTWKPAVDGYQHHNRPPHGVCGELWRPLDQGQGGVMHLQFVNKRRLLAKHVLYRMVDHLRWPGRRTVERLNEIYDQALRPPPELAEVPGHWWGEHWKDQIKLETEPWHEAEIGRLLRKHGREKFDGLDLKGF